MCNNKAEIKRIKKALKRIKRINNNIYTILL
jgi:hypothetical protein